MLAWILEYAGLNPGFLIGGVPSNFGISARLGGSKYFVVEADEYDTAFFDKRAKFVHYRPRTLIVNNIEYDHADIYADVDAIIWQFHQLLRTVPGNGLIVANGKDANIERLLTRGVGRRSRRSARAIRAARWSAPTTQSASSRASASSSGGRARGSGRGRCSASTISRTRSRRSRRRATSAWRPTSRCKRSRSSKASSAGSSYAARSRASLCTRTSRIIRPRSRRRCRPAEPRAAAAHRRRHGAALEHDAHGRAPRHAARLVRRRRSSVRARRRRLGFDPAAALAPLGERLVVAADVQTLLERLLDELTAGDHVVLMSNGSFQGLPRLLEQALAARAAAS